jgi:uncharacterized membrane protein YwaF
MVFRTVLIITHFSLHWGESLLLFQETFVCCVKVYPWEIGHSLWKAHLMPFVRYVSVVFFRVLVYIICHLGGFKHTFGSSNCNE